MTSTWKITQGLKPTRRERQQAPRIQRSRCAPRRLALHAGSARAPRRLMLHTGLRSTPAHAPRPHPSPSSLCSSLTCSCSSLHHLWWSLFVSQENGSLPSFSLCSLLNYYVVRVGTCRDVCVEARGHLCGAAPLFPCSQAGEV